MTWLNYSTHNVSYGELFLENTTMAVHNITMEHGLVTNA